MLKSRTSTVTTSWLAASGLIAGASVVGSGVVSSTAEALAAQPSNCPSGTYLVATRVCELYVSSSTTWNAPSSVKTLQILTVGGGGGGGGGTTYAPGGGGGGGAVHECTTSIVNLSHHLIFTDGAGGSGGANGSAYIYNSSYGAEHADPGTVGGVSSASANSQLLCHANGGLGGQSGWHYLVANLPTTALYGGGGNSGSGVLGGSADGLETSNAVNHCIGLPWEYNLVASGGAGGQVGLVPSGSVSGAGGSGTNYVSGLFAQFFWTFGAGGGGGGGRDCKATTTGGVGGNGGGGAGGGAITAAISAHGNIVNSAVAGLDGTGGGGGGGSGTNIPTQLSLHGTGTPGANGGSGVIVVRFAEPTLDTNVYFATSSSTLTASDKVILANYATTAITDNMTTVAVQGFTDPRGSVAFNQTLSVARAMSVKSFLVKLFAAHHAHVAVSATGKGEMFTFTDFAKDRVATLSASGGTLHLKL